MADVTAAPMPLMLAGTEYLMCPLSDKDIAELDNWLRSGMIKAASDSLTDDMSQAARDEVLRVAITEARSTSFLTGTGARVMATPDGIARVLWQGLKRRHPELTHEKVREMLGDPRTIEYCMLQWHELNVGKMAQATEKAGAGKKPRRPRPRSSSTRR